MEYAIRKQGIGETANFVLIDRVNFSLIDVSFSTKKNAEDYAKKHGLVINSSSMDD